MTDQIAIVVSGVVAVALSQSERASTRRWSSVFGLLGQPWWLYMAASHELWGLFVVSVLYTVVWAKGFHVHWIRRS